MLDSIENVQNEAEHHKNVRVTDNLGRLMGSNPHSDPQSDAPPLSYSLRGTRLVYHNSLFPQKSHCHIYQQHSGMSSFAPDSAAIAANTMDKKTIIQSIYSYDIMAVSANIYFKYLIVFFAPAKSAGKEILNHENSKIFLQSPGNIHLRMRSALHRRTGKQHRRC